MANNNNNNSGAPAAGGISPQAAALGAASINALGGLAIESAKNKKQWKYQQKSLALQQKLNLEAWNLQNQYNTPQQQMQRLQAAGLNPNLIYGEGSSAPNMSGPLNVPDVPVRQAVGPQIPDLMQYYQIRQMDAQYRQTTMATDIMQKTAGLKDIETALKNLNLVKEQSKAPYYNEMALIERDLKKFASFRADQLSANEIRKGGLMDQLVHMREKQMTGIELDNTFKQHRNELAKFGIYTSDHPLFRVFIQATHRMNMSLDDLLKESPASLKHLIQMVNP